MDLPAILVNASTAILHLDLNLSTYRVLLPYTASIHTAADRLYVLRGHNEQTRLDVHDRRGLLWSRRLEYCFDSHGVAEVGDTLAVCSTGTNEIIFLNSDGLETRRWSPDPAAEADSWHLNSMTVSGGRLYVTCFGRFAHFRGWEGNVEGSGLLIEVDSNQVVRNGLSSPHDPRRLDDGWLINDSHHSRTLFYPDQKPARVVMENDGFPRGVVVLPEHFILGYSSPRDLRRANAIAVVLVVERSTLRVVKSINLPYAEIGHLCLAPSAELLHALESEQTGIREHFGLYHNRQVIAEPDRAGSIEVVRQPVPSKLIPGAWDLLVRLTNRGKQVWSSGNEPPIHVAYQIVDATGEVLMAEGQRTQLPVPIYPGKHLTFPVHFGLRTRAIPSGARLQFTVVQETVAWWKKTGIWQPATLLMPEGHSLKWATQLVSLCK